MQSSFQGPAATTPSWTIKPIANECIPSRRESKTTNDPSLCIQLFENQVAPPCAWISCRRMPAPDPNEFPLSSVDQFALQHPWPHPEIPSCTCSKERKARPPCSDASMRIKSPRRISNATPLERASECKPYTGSKTGQYARPSTRDKPHPLPSHPQARPKNENQSECARQSSTVPTKKKTPGKMRGNHSRSRPRFGRRPACPGPRRRCRCPN
jgi:hypothetical protein